MRKKKRAKLTSELDEFMARTTKADLEVEDPLEWWVCHASDYPVLSRMAFDLFSCPAMSAECERVFSGTKKVITDERNRLSSDTVAAIECQKHLLRSGVLASVWLTIKLDHQSIEFKECQVVKYLTPDGEERTTLDREVIRQLHRFESLDSPSNIVGPIVVASGPAPGHQQRVDSTRDNAATVFRRPKSVIQHSNRQSSSLTGQVKFNRVGRTFNQSSSMVDVARTSLRCQGQQPGMASGCTGAACRHDAVAYSESCLRPQWHRYKNNMCDTEDPSFVGWLQRGLLNSGYQASTPWSSTGSTQARTALCIALGRGPCLVFASPRRWCATACALAVHFSTWVLNVRVLSSQIPSQRIAFSGRLSPSWRIGGDILGLVRQKCMTSAFAGSKLTPLAAPHVTSSLTWRDALLAVISSEFPTHRIPVSHSRIDPSDCPGDRSALYRARREWARRANPAAARTAVGNWPW
ncbi:hypothetical protein VFPBJ_11508 [Purpureocillium lilacinum]|uniref:HAT C-terminal dimerisation domain-containing protein n=1 Tax=Purpureocillium lilacinum TaxID=33203 RepID=A0A179F5Y2_PURLI|nr:hypothetical protein VFPBJ_11508 [Purpureocillium lilacinum]